MKNTFKVGDIISIAYARPRTRRFQITMIYDETFDCQEINGEYNKRLYSGITFDGQIVDETYNTPLMKAMREE